MVSEEFIIKLFYFYIVGFIIGLMDFFFLSITENVTKQKGTFNPSYYYPVSYGILLPILSFFIMPIYYPIGMIKFQDYSINFLLDHMIARVFSFLGLIVFFLLLIILNSYHIFSVEIYMDWLLEVIFVFIIFQFVPFYPSLMGIFILKHCKDYFIYRNKIFQIWHMNLFAQCSSFLFIYFVLSLNHNLLAKKMNIAMNFIEQHFNLVFYIACVLLILTVMFYLFYLKKKKYQQYLAFVKQILTNSLFKEEMKK